MRLSHSVLVPLVVFGIACGGGGSGSPTGPTGTTAPASTTWTLSGAVRDAQNGAPLAEVTVVITDGPDANRSSTSDASGNYSLANLQQGGFTVRFSRSSYDALSRGVTLTQNTTLDVTLTRSAIPSANLQASGQGSFFNCSPLVGFCSAFQVSIQNIGAGCATGTAVIVRFFNASGSQIGSDVQLGAIGTSLGARIIRPQEIVALTSLQPIPTSTADAMRSYRLFPTWNDVRCP